MAVERLRQALVLSGGGAKGAYEVGVIRALCEGQSPATDFRPLTPEVFTGTSVGAYNAAYLATRAGMPLDLCARELEAIWRERIANTFTSCGNGVFRLRGLPMQGFDPSCFADPLGEVGRLAKDAAYFADYFVERGANFLLSDQPLRARLLDTFDLSALFAPEPLWDLVRSTIDCAALLSSPAELNVVASNWKDGVPRLFENREIAERVGPAAIVASAAIPAILPPVEIDGVPFIDGGVTMNTPLKPAIADGADMLHVVFVDPLLSTVPFPALPNTLDTMYRIYAILVAKAINHDLFVAETVNRELELHARLGLLRDPSPPATAGLTDHSRILRRFREGRPYRKLSIHRYRPKTDLGGVVGLLDFRQSNIEAMLRMGYEDAVQHDCAWEGCVLAHESEAQREAAQAVARAEAEGPGP